MSDPVVAAPTDLFTTLDAPEGEVPTPSEPVVDTPDPTPAPDTVAAVPPSPPAADVTPAPAAEPEKPVDRSVPLAVFLDERKAHKEEMAALRAEMEKLKAPPAADAEPEKDYLDDPKGYADEKFQRLQAKLEALEKTGGEKLQAIDQRTQAAELDRQLNVTEGQFVAKTPDYADALAHVRTVRVQQLRLTNPNATDQQIVQHIGAEERQVAAALIAQGRNPAEYVYRVAETLGYTRRQQTPTPEAKPNGASAGTVPADVTLNRTPGNAPGPDEGGDEEQDMLAQAQSERFRKRA